MRVPSGDQTGSSSFQIAGGVSWVTPLPSSRMTKISWLANAIRPSAFPVAVLAAIRGAVGASRSQPAADARTRSAPMMREVFMTLRRRNRCAALRARRHGENRWQDHGGAAVPRCTAAAGSVLQARFLRKTLHGFLLLRTETLG